VIIAHATGPLDKQNMDMKRYLEDENTQMYNSASALTSMAKAEVLADVITVSDR
jgi:hypothetical protein